MASLTDHRVLTFDCYGTIIDWESGVIAALHPLLSANNATDTFTRQHLLETYHQCEAAQQRLTPDLNYDQLLTAIHPHIATKLNLEPPSAEENSAFGASVGSWPAFPDSVDALRRLGKHYKLVILSNVDRSSFSKTNAGPLEGHPFDLIITAEDVGSYKPDLKNFEYMLSKVKERWGVGREGVLQTAQSQFHDHRPAREMGIRSSWIVRPGAVMGNVGGEIYDWRFDTLGEMADAVEAEVRKKD